MNEVLNFLSENWLTGLELSVVIYEILVRVVKTERNLSILNFVWQILNVIIPNRSKKGGTFKMIALLCMLSLPAFSQLNGTFKTVRFVNVLDSTTVLPINGSIYYNEQSDKFRVYQNNVWYDLLGSGGGGSVASGNGITVSGGTVNWGNTWSAPISLPHSNGLSYMFLDSLQYNVYIGEGGDSELLVNSGGVFLASYSNPVSINVDGANSRIDLDNSNGNVFLGSPTNGLTAQNLLVDGTAANIDLNINSKGTGLVRLNNPSTGNYIELSNAEIILNTQNGRYVVQNNGLHELLFNTGIQLQIDDSDNAATFETTGTGGAGGFVFNVTGGGSGNEKVFTINLQNVGDYLIVTGLPTVNPCGTAPSGTIWSNGGILTICP